MQTCHAVRIYTSTMVDGRRVPWSMYYDGRGKDGDMETRTEPHSAALMTEALAKLLVTKLTCHHAEVCELLCNENSTIDDSLQTDCLTVLAV